MRYGSDIVWSRSAASSNESGSRVDPLRYQMGEGRFRTGGIRRPGFGFRIVDVTVVRIHDDRLVRNLSDGPNCWKHTITTAKPDTDTNTR